MNAQPRKQEPQPQGITRWRFALVLGVFAVLLLAVLVRLVMLHTVEQPFLFEQGEKRTVRTEVQPAMRGMITDRFGKPLAVSTPVVNLWLNPQQVNVQQLPVIAADLGMNVRELVRRTERAAASGRSFLYLRRQVEPALAQQVLDRRVAGVYGEDDFRRFYPAAEVTAHTLGIVNIDGRGQEGLELAYDAYLQGKPGSRQVVKDLYGNVIKQLQVREVAQPGGDLQLTIDLRLQYLAYRELKAAVNQHKASSGSAVLLDARSGDVLALVSQPSYNPNNRAALRPEHMRNRAVADLIEPGSTIKPFTVAAALMSGRYSPGTEVNTAPGFMRIRNKTIRDHRNLGMINMGTLLQKSSNVASTKIALSLPPDAITNMQKQFGFGKKTPLQFPGEGSGLVVTPKEKETSRRATVSYGYGLQVTLAQVAQAYSALAAGGVMHPLTLIKDDKPQPSKRIMAHEQAMSIVQMMESVTEPGGTAKGAAIDGYRVAGKTGTSRRINPKGGYYTDQYRNVFAGMAPASNPRLVGVMLIEDPRAQIYAGLTVAPVFHNVMKEALRLYNVPLDKPLKTEEP